MDGKEENDSMDGTEENEIKSHSTMAYEHSFILVSSPPGM